MNTSATQPAPQSAPTQRQRWVKYGLNVGVLLIALLLIVFVVNFAAFRHRQRLDFTHNRRYTLSPQTLRMLERLDRPVTITTLYREGTGHAEQLAEVDNLLAEYRFRGKQLAVEHIDPALDLPRFEEFTEKLLARFSDQVQKQTDAVAQARDLLRRLDELSRQQSDALTQLIAVVGDSDADTVRFIRQLDDAFQGMAAQLPEVEKQIERRLQGGGEMPDFEQVRPIVQQALSVSSTGVLQPAINRFTLLVDRAGTPGPAKEQMLILRDQYKELNGEIGEALEAMEQIESGPLEEVRADLLRENCVVVTVDQPEKPAAEPPPADKGKDHRGVTVLTIDELYPGYITAEKAGGELRPEQAYKGEEAITGALMMLTLEHKTRVVFVNASPRPALEGPLGQRDGYQLVAQRLRAMNFQVEEWQPGGGAMFGRPTPPQPKPTPKEGETLVFIGLPTPMPDPSMPVNPAADLAANAIKEHIEAGLPAMIMTSPTSRFELASEPNALLELLKNYGLEVESQKLVFRPAPGRDKGGFPQHPLSTAGSEHPVARAVGGLPGVVIAPQPIVLKSDAAGVQTWPLLRTESGTWADADALPLSQEKLMELTNDAGESQGPITIAAAAQKDKQRLIVVASPLWASDDITVRSQMAGTSLMNISLYSEFPGNTELFVNGVYWLAGLDDLIAPGAKTQETRRIEGLGEGALRGLRWASLAGLPIACLAAGVVVWFVRRK